LDDEGIIVQNPGGRINFLFSKEPIPVLVPTQVPIQQEMGALSQGDKAVKLRK
jgi:hypothetical protein